MAPDRLPSNVSIRTDLRPGDIGYITYLHGTLYAKEYGWDYTFEAYVAAPLAEFARRRNSREGIWIVEKDEVVLGSVAIVESSERKAQLRWLLIHPDLRGCGVGRILMVQTIGFCRENNYAGIFLLTVDALTAAAALYKAFGFRVTEETAHELWGKRVTEQRYELDL